MARQFEPVQHLESQFAQRLFRDELLAPAPRQAALPATPRPAAIIDHGTTRGLGSITNSALPCCWSPNTTSRCVRSGRRRSDVPSFRKRYSGSRSIATGRRSSVTSQFQPPPAPKRTSGRSSPTTSATSATWTGPSSTASAPGVRVLRASA
ncbi:MAG: hypothetical protein IPH48_22110 [bacterium]|nr:hypothetical protein [bacterium]